MNINEICGSHCLEWTKPIGILFSNQQFVLCEKYLHFCLTGCFVHNSLYHGKNLLTTLNKVLSEHTLMPTVIWWYSFFCFVFYVSAPVCKFALYSVPLFLLFSLRVIHLTEFGEWFSRNVIKIWLVVSSFYYYILEHFSRFIIRLCEYDCVNSKQRNSIVEEMISQTLYWLLIDCHFMRWCHNSVKNQMS